MSELNQAQREELRDILREVVSEVMDAEFLRKFARETLDNNETSRCVMRRNEPYIRHLVREELEQATKEFLAAQKSRLGREIQQDNKNRAAG